MERKIGQVGGEARQPGRIHFLDQQLVERARQVLGETQRLGRADSQVPLDEPGQQHQPFQRLDRRRDRLLAVERLEQAADPLIDLRIADRHQPRQQQARRRSGAGTRPGSRARRGCSGTSNRP